MERVKRNLNGINDLVESFASKRRKIVRNANSDFTKAIADICYNIIKGNLVISEENKQQLKKNKKPIRKMADKKIPTFIKKKMMVQKGGILPGLIPAISIAASILGSLL